jgi:hypothetical protein
MVSNKKGTIKSHLFVNDFILTQLIGKDINEIWNVTNPMGQLVQELKINGSDSELKTRYKIIFITINPCY